MAKKANENQTELRNIVEAALFAADEPLTIADLIGLFPSEAQPTRNEIAAVLSQLEAQWVERGVELKRVGKAYRFHTREQYAPWMRKLLAGRPPRYSRALLETLAIIAYRQPVTRGDVEEIRGVSLSTETMRILLERSWVKEVGHRDTPGRPALFGTTREFLEYFNLKGLNELPPLKERREIAEIAQELNLRLPFNSEQDADGEAEPGETQTGTHSAEIIPLQPATSDAGADVDGDRETS